MKVWITLLSVVALTVLAAVGAHFVPTATRGMVAVPDAEAATLYGGGFDCLWSGNKCSGSKPGCRTTSGYYVLDAGTREAQNQYCGVSDCGVVPKDRGPCEGASALRSFRRDESR